MSLPPNWRELDWAVNAYTCERCKHVFTTVDVDEGTTPFMTTCPKCPGLAQSACYPTVRPVPASIPVPTMEWYKPTPADTKRRGTAEREHIRMGGLLCRPWTGKTPIPNPYRPRPTPKATTSTDTKEPS